MTSLTRFWEVVDSSIYHPPTTYEELLALDLKHINIGLGDLWLVSERRQEIKRDITKGLVQKMHEGIVQIPEEVIMPGALQGTQRVPVVAYFKDGEPGTIVGQAVVEESSIRGETALISKMEISGEYAEKILQGGTQAFSIGFPPPAIDESNQSARPSRWQRRGKKGR